MQLKSDDHLLASGGANPVKFPNGCYHLMQLCQNPELLKNRAFKRKPVRPFNLCIKRLDITSPYTRKCSQDAFAAIWRDSGGIKHSHLPGKFAGIQIQGTKPSSESQRFLIKSSCQRTQNGVAQKNIGSRFCCEPNQALIDK